VTYPINCIKGIPNADFLIEDGSIGSHLFYFKKEHIRDDGRKEQSINWEDDSNAIEFTINQKKDDDSIQFKAGVAIVPRDEIDRLGNMPTVKGLLSYERQPLDINPYHGNLLLAEGVPNHTMKKLAAGLALAVTKIIPSEHQ
jgi:hypothetical protein